MARHADRPQRRQLRRQHPLEVLRMIAADSCTVTGAGVTATATVCSSGIGSIGHVLLVYRRDAINAIDFESWQPVE